ncbi:MAG: zinc metallopeptidase [Oscillospiraceae bacterium]|nr:zinc metallopeptidase [Oscillospiraceae bacterium]
MLWYDPTYLIMIPAIIFALIADSMVKSNFSKYSKEESAKGVTGADAARAILNENGLYNVGIEAISGELTDHYDPTANVIRLSQSVYGSTSIAAIGVAAHEAGHAVQHSEQYVPIKIRTAVIPVSKIGSSLSMPLVLLGLFFSFKPLITAGIFAFTAVVLLQLITLPVEFNASSRALKALDNQGILFPEELGKAKKVLSAAAMTYVAAMLSSLLTLLRLILLSRRRK